MFAGIVPTLAAGADPMGGARGDIDSPSDSDGIVRICEKICLWNSCVVINKSMCGPTENAVHAAQAFDGPPCFGPSTRSLEPGTACFYVTSVWLLRHTAQMLVLVLKPGTKLKPSHQDPHSKNPSIQDPPPRRHH